MDPNLHMFGTKTQPLQPEENSTPKKKEKKSKVDFKEEATATIEKVSIGKMEELDNLHQRPTSPFKKAASVLNKYFSEGSALKEKGQSQLNEPEPKEQEKTTVNPLFGKSKSDPASIYFDSMLRKEMKKVNPELPSTTILREDSKVTSELKTYVKAKCLNWLDDTLLNKKMNKALEQQVLKFVKGNKTEEMRKECGKNLSKIFFESFVANLPTLDKGLKTIIISLNKKINKKFPEINSECRTFTIFSLRILMPHLTKSLDKLFSKLGFDEAHSRIEIIKAMFDYIKELEELPKVVQPLFEE